MLPGLNGFVHPALALVDLGQHCPAAAIRLEFGRYEELLFSATQIARGGKHISTSEVDVGTFGKYG